MDENLHNIDKLFRDAIEGHEEMPPENVWKALDAGLDKSNTAHINRKYQAVKRLAIALMLFLLITISYEIITKRTAEPGTSKNEKNLKSPADNSAVNSSSTEPLGKPNYQPALLTPKTNASNMLAQKSSPVEPTTRSQIKDITRTKKPPALLSKRYYKTTTENGAMANEQTPFPADEETFTETAKDKNDDVLKGDEHHPGKNNKDVPGITQTPVVAFAESCFLQKYIATVNTVDVSDIQHTKITPGNVLPPGVVKINFQKNKKTGISKPVHFTLAAFFSPQLSFDRLENEHHPGGPQSRSGRDRIKGDETNQSSFSTGILVKLPLAKSWGIQSGITYSHIKIDMQPKQIFAGLDNDGKVKYRFDCSSGYSFISPGVGAPPAVGDSINVTASTSTLQYVGIPLALSFHFAVGKFNIIPVVGAVANFVVKQKIETGLLLGTSKENQTINSIDGLKSNYFNATMGIGFEYNLSKRVALSITPSINIALNSINKNAAVKSYPNSFGLPFGISLKF